MAGGKPKMAYKITDQDDRTYNGCQWGENVTHTSSGTGPLCTEGWIHYYTDPLLAVLMNPIHGAFDNEAMRLWKCKAGGAHKSDHGLKEGCTSLTTIRRVEIPKVSTEQRVRFAILCARAVCKDPGWVSWSDKWLAGTDRSAATAGEAAKAEAKAAWAYCLSWTETAAGEATWATCAA